MKYSVHDYAKALDEALANPKVDHAAAAKRFLALASRNGDEVRLKKILDEAARLSRGRNGLREVLVESARPLTKAQQAMLAKFLKPGDVVKYEIDPDLIAGVKLIVNDERELDGSLQRKLDIMFGG
ncbi:MAG TPA: F0F1 ATP synthase subunit delta [Candidatus Paceibacterota bacterium]|nr:F0F1 ATP synthase subunit delta [Candidatus Paceibacterota bacterium]